MSREFEMSMMGELQFFLGLQIKQSKEGTFVHQAKYTKDIVRKFKMEDSKAMTTPMSMTTALDADEEGEHMDQKEYWSMIGSILYLTETRPDIQFLVCPCARCKASSRTSHRQAVKRIFRYLHHTPDFGLWYSASSSLALHGFSDADFAGCRLERKSTSGTCQFLGSSLVSRSSRKQSSVAQSTTEAGFAWIVGKNTARRKNSKFQAIDLPIRSIDQIETLGIVGAPRGLLLARSSASKTHSIKRNRKSTLKNTFPWEPPKSPKSKPFQRVCWIKIT
jgi:hypothetical protein